MLGRLGIAGRLLTIMLLMSLALIAIGSGLAFVANSSRDDEPPALPLPEQVAAIVGLLDTLDETGDAELIKALNSSRLIVKKSLQRPDPADVPARRPGLERLVQRYSETFKGRELLVSISEEDDSARPRLSRIMGHRAITLAVSLKSGGYALFETRGVVVTRVLGWPVGFFIGLIGALVGLAAIWAVISEARPLKQLVASVDRFGERAEPAPVTPSGAPEIKRLIRASNEMQSRISSLLAGRTLFLGAVSHDLKTFLTRFRLRIEDIPEEEQRQRAVRDLDDMTRLLDDALAMAANMNGGQRRFHLDLAQLLESECSDRVADRVSFGAPSPPGQSWEIDGDPVALRRVFANLIDNALAFANRCEVTLARGETSILASVDDDGPGIPESERERAFEPFYRADTSRSRATGGSGLGLAIAKQIVEAHGGGISISQSPLGGARVLVELPASAS
jgi:two-component system, OmpR family, osmolarity sensor histidine kinase EnvZ